MTFSLKSNFSGEGRRALLITADKAIVYLSRGGSVTESYVFSADETGLANFSRYLTESALTPVHILVDVVEEEYRQDVIPHVFGSDRRSVLERKYARLFRGTQYCLAIAQGRETEGRKDDRVLLTALTKPDLITPWVTQLSAHKVPVAGIFSVPLLSDQLLPKINATGQNILLISVQSAGGLRQTFFRDGQLKISRLAQMPRPGAVSYAQHLIGELAKLRRYLNSLALVSRDSPLEIYILSHGELLGELEQYCRNSDAEQYYLVDIAALAPRMHIDSGVNTPYSDAIFAQLVLDTPTRRNYARPDETRYYKMYQARVGMLVASMLLLLASTCWSGLNFIEGVSLKQQALDAEQKARFYQTRFEMDRQGLPPTPVDPQDIKTAVDLVATLKARKSSPLPLLQVFSHALEQAPSIALDRVEWLVASTPEEDDKTKTRTTNRSVPVPVPVRDPAYLHYHIATFHGHITPFDGDYRSAIELIDALAAAMKTETNVVQTQVTAYPIDVRSNTSVTGNTLPSKAQHDAKFSVRVVLGVPHGASQG